MHLERVETMILRFVNVTSARWWKRTTARRGRLLSLDPTSKKTVSSSRLITVLASKQPALLRDFKGCTGAGGVAIAKACTGGRERRTEGEREREREKGEMKGYRGSNCAYVSTSWPIQLSIGWQRRILNGTPTQITRVPYIFGSSNYALEILQLQLDNFDISIYFDIYFEFSDVMLDA